MRVLDRYIGSQVAYSTCFSVVVLSVVLVLARVFKQLLDLLVNQDAPLDLILSVVGYILPFSLTFTIPWGFLTAVLLVFGRLSAENELTAMRASGLSIPRITLPIFALAAVSMVVCGWINLDIAPRAQSRMKQALFNIATSNPLALFESGRVIDKFPGQKIYVERTEGNRLFNMSIYRLDKESFPMTVTFVEEGELATDLQNMRVLLRYRGGRYESRDRLSPADVSLIRDGAQAEEGTLELPLAELYEKNKKKKGLSTMTLQELLAAGPQSEPNRESGKGKKKPEVESPIVELSKRVSFAVTPIVFALIGIPLAIGAQRRETSIGFVISLGVGMLYYLLLILADSTRGKPQLHPEWLVWLPNLLFFIGGLVLFTRLERR